MVRVGAAASLTPPRPGLPSKPHATRRNEPAYGVAGGWVAGAAPTGDAPGDQLVDSGIDGGIGIHFLEKKQGGQRLPRDQQGVNC